MIKIVIITTAYKRPLIIDLFLKNFIAVQEEVKDWCELSLVCALGLGEFTQIEESYKQFVNFKIHENFPLSKKWNHAVAKCKMYSPDYILTAGSDDIFNAQLLHSYKKHIDDGCDYIGLLDSYYYYIYYPDCMRYSSGYTGERQGEPDGGGRLIHKSILEKVNYKLWDDELNSGLDLSMTNRIKPFIKKSKFITGKEEGIYFIDIKSDVNITHFNDIKEPTIPTDEATKILKSFSIYDDIMKTHKIYVEQSELNTIAAAVSLHLSKPTPDYPL